MQKRISCHWSYNKDPNLNVSCTKGPPCYWSYKKGPHVNLSYKRKAHVNMLDGKWAPCHWSYKEGIYVNIYKRESHVTLSCKNYPMLISHINGIPC